MALNDELKAYFQTAASDPTDAEQIATEKANEMAEILEKYFSGNLPIGAIIAWHKSFANTPALSDNFVECNGQVLDDEESPYHTQTIPNLNGDARFLRGGETSGVEQADAFQGHWHNTLTGASGGGTGARLNRVASSNTSNTNSAVRQPTNDGVNGEPRIADETRPVNMSMVWIMRVK